MRARRAQARLCGRAIPHFANFSAVDALDIFPVFPQNALMTNAYAGRVPDWNDSGLLPPFLDSPASPRDRSPYRAPLGDAMIRFGSANAGRRALQSGLLDFRAALHRAGLTRGFQWIDGSFVEYVEASQDDGTRERIHYALRSEVRRAAGRNPEPSAAVIDSQSVKTTQKGGSRA